MRSSLSILSLLFVLLLAPGPVYAQQVSAIGEEDRILIETLRDQNHLSTSEEIYPAQLPGSNRKEILGSGSGNFNEAVILQQGNHSDIRLYQYGTGHRAGLFQSGDYNAIELAEYGIGVSSRVIQSGVGLGVRAEWASLQSSYTILQQGYGHRVTDLGSGPNSPGYIIRQQGMAGMKVEVRQR